MIYSGYSFSSPKPPTLQKISNSAFIKRITTIHLALFILWALARVICTLVGQYGIWEYVYKKTILHQDTLGSQLWAILTYHWVYNPQNLLEPLFYIFLIYAWGNISIRMFGKRHFTILYIISIIGTGLGFSILASYLSKLQTITGTVLGPSATVYTFIAATAAYNPHNYHWILPIQARYIALFSFLQLCTRICLSEENAILLSSLLGMILGGFYGFMKRMAFEKQKNRFSKTKNHHKAYHPSQPDTELTEVDAILEKISRTGYHSLTSKEKKRLFEKSR